MSGTSTIIDVAGLVKAFGPVRALDGLDLAVKPGEVHGFLGPNGAGKSTTIRVLLGLMQADAGSVELFGGDPWRAAAHLHRRLAYVPGDVALWPGLTGGESLDVLASTHGATEERRRRELLDRFDLDPTKRCRDYSKGNRQKVALVAALSAQVELLVLDEPTSGLDPLMEQQFQQVIRERRDEGVSVLLSSHILDEVEALADSVTIIREGRRIQTGTMVDLRRQTRTSVHAVTRDAPASLATAPGVADYVVGGAAGAVDSRFTVAPDHLDDAIGLLHAARIHTLTVNPPSLDTLFLRSYDDVEGSDTTRGQRVSTQGLRVMIGIQRKIRWKGIVVWVLALTATLAATAASIAGLYSTPTKIHSYAASVAGGSLYAINGKVEGIDSLGGIIQDEFAFVAAFLVPLVGISLIAGSTRREEEAGRLELLRSGRIGRRAPLIAALLVASGVIAAIVVAFAAVLAVSGVPVSSSILYAASLGGLAFVFVGVSAVIAQMTLHARGVYVGGFAVLIVSYVLRGVGDVGGSALSWLSPLGWQEKTAPTGDQRWWALLIPMVVGGALAAVAVRHEGHRDLGSALINAGSGPARASYGLRSPLGFAMRLHRSSMLGWLAGSVVLGVMMGALSQQAIDALQGNPSMAQALGAGTGSLGNGFVAVVEVYLALIAMGYVVQAIGMLRHEESSQRLEARLTGTLSRMHWLAAHATVTLSGLLVIVVTSSASFGIASALSTGGAGQVAIALRSGLAYLPAEVVIAGSALLLFGMFPRRLAVSWAYYAAVAFLAFLGSGLHLSHWVLDLSPTSHVGNPPVGPAATVPLVVMTVIAGGLLAAGFVGFRRRDVPAT